MVGENVEVGIILIILIFFVCGTRVPSSQKPEAKAKKKENTHYLRQANKARIVGKKTFIALNKTKRR